MTFTVNGVQVAQGEHTVYSHRGCKTTVTPVLLAQAYRGFAPGTRIGTVQSKRFTGQMRKKFGDRVFESATFTDHSAVQGHAYDWLIREFAENQGGERQARLTRIQPGSKYSVTHMFGYMSHDPCIYDRGDQIEVVDVTDDKVVTQVTRCGAAPKTETWNRESFEAMVHTFTILEVKSE